MPVDSLPMLRGGTGQTICQREGDLKIAILRMASQLKSVPVVRFRYLYDQIILSLNGREQLTGMKIAKCIVKNNRVFAFM